MGSFFVNPLMLLFGTAIAAPIIIFLLTRYRYRTIEWAALIFLQRALKREQRRLRLENLILLIIRCLLLMLFALVLARPRSPERVAVNPEDKRHNVVVALDTSYSMGYQIGSDDAETAYQRGLRAVKELIGSLGDGDRLVLTGFDETLHELTTVPRNMNEAGKEELQNELDGGAEELELTARGTDLGEVLHAIPRILVRFEPDGLAPAEGIKPLQKTVFIVTDATRRGLLDGSGALIDPNLRGVAQDIEKLGGTLVLVDCGADDPRNASVTRLATRELVVGQEIPCHIEAGIKNWSNDAINDLTVEYYVDGADEPQKSVSLSLPGGEEVTPEGLRYVFREAGPHRVAVHLSSDALAIDNWRHLVVDVRKGVKVLLVDGEKRNERWESETDFLSEVLKLAEFTTEDGQGLLRPDVVDEAGFSSQKLEEYDVVVLANVGQLEDEMGARLEAYARNGGAVLFTVGEQVKQNLQSWNQVLWRGGFGLLPAELIEARGGTRSEAQTDTEAPAWAMSLGRDRQGVVPAMFAGEEMFSWLRLCSVYGFIRVQVPGYGPGGAAAPPGEGAPGAENGGDQRPVSVALTVVPRRAADDGGVDGPGGADDDPGLPILLERPFGRGRAILWLSSADHDWNNCVMYDGFYVPFWRQLVLDLAQRARPPLNLPLGGRFERLLRPEEYSAVIEVESPDPSRPAENIQAQKLDGQEMYRLVYPTPENEKDRPATRAGTDRPGLYTITRKQAGDGGEAPDYFAVTIDPGEGDLAKFTAEELSEAQALGIPVRTSRPDVAREVLKVDGGVGGAQEFWKHVLVAVLALLALESILAAAFGRRRRS